MSTPRRRARSHAGGLASRGRFELAAMALAVLSAGTAAALVPSLQPASGAVRSWDEPGPGAPGGSAPDQEDRLCDRHGAGTAVEVDRVTAVDVGRTTSVELDRVTAVAC